MKDVTTLRNDLLDVYEKTKAKEMDLNVTKELANIAGKILKSAALELAYNQFKKQSDKEIPFLQG
jgi:hypothetical protein